MGLVSLEMKPGSFRKAHRWLGLFFSFSILTSSGSGILHNVMTYTQPPPPPRAPLRWRRGRRKDPDTGHRGYR